MTEIETLIVKLDTFPYPDSMDMVKAEIPGLAFFPGGKGIYHDNDETISNKKIMILGQDFDSETSYQASFKAGKEDEVKNPTWRNLLAFLEKVGIDRSNCFFTNGIMGIRTDDKSTGPSPAFKDDVFLNNCRNFFLEQISIQRPKLILVLGTYTAKFLSATSPDLDCWSVVRPFKIIDHNKHHVKEKVKFKNGVESNLVLLTHPSFRPVNVGRRTYNELKGTDAEIGMVKSILT